jgi:hypothetical protein
MYAEIRKHARTPLRHGSLWALLAVGLMLGVICVL